MNYIINVLLIGINIVLFGLKPKKNKNEYLDAINKNERIILLKELKIFNILLIIINIVFIVLQILSNNQFIVDIIVTLALLISFILSTRNKLDNKNKYTIIGDSNITLYRMIINALLLLIFMEKLVKIKDLYQLGIVSIIGLIPVIINLIRLLKLTKEYKDIIVYKAKKEDILTDIKTSLYIETANILKYLGLGIMIVFVMYVKINFAFILYILVVLLLFVIYNMKVGKINKEKKRVYDSIFSMKQMPGPMYTMQFKKDYNLATNIIIFTIMFALLSVTSYLVGEIEFIIIGLDIVLIALYLIIRTRKQFIYSIYSLNKEHINKDKYKININDNITDVIDYKNILLNINLYKIIYIDKNNNLYTSEIELYNIKDLYKDIEIYINNTNLNDYIVVEEEYY